MLIEKNDVQKVVSLKFLIEFSHLSYHIAMEIELGLPSNQKSFPRKKVAQKMVKPVYPRQVLKMVLEVFRQGKITVIGEPALNMVENLSNEGFRQNTLLRKIFSSDSLSCAPDEKTLQICRRERSIPWKELNSLSRSCLEYA